MGISSFEHLVGFGGDRAGLSRFIVVGMRGSCNGFAVVGVSVAARRGNVVDLSKCMARAFLPPGNRLL